MTGTRESRETIEVQGRERRYLTVAPAAPRGDGAAPALVLVLHGSQQSGPAVRRAAGGGLDALAADGSAVVVYPDAYRGLWNDTRRSMRSPARREGVDDAAFVDAVVARLQGVHGGGPVIAAGYSNGGQMVLRLLLESRPWLAGTVVVAATMPTQDNLLVEDRGVPLPVVLVHGTRDPIVPYAGGMASLWGFRPRGEGLSAPDTAALLARRNGITAAPTETSVPHRSGSGRTSVTRIRYAASGAPAVELYTVENGGHAIPNPTRRAFLALGRTTHDIDVTELVRGLVPDPPTPPPE